mgnify:CR=1 FL=1
MAATGADESFLYTVRGAFAANLVLGNGAEIGFRASGGLDRDNPARAGFSGVPGPARPLPSPAGALSGLARGPAAEDAGPRGRIETGYVYIEGGYGELRAGLDEGVAARFFEGAPTLFRHAALVNPALDPSGQVIARTDHDLTGPSFKVSYATPRILGARAGVSLTPDANAGGLDRDPVRNLGGAAGPDIENAVEAGLNVSRRLPRSGVRLRAAAGWSRANAAQACLAQVLEYSKTRELFGRPLAANQAIQIRLAEMARRITTSQLLSMQLGRLKDQGRMAPAQVSLAKWHNCRAAIEVARDARDMLGGSGITADYVPIRHALNLESVITYEGTETIHQLAIGRELTGLNAF